jgi:hypothetical protein
MKKKLKISKRNNISSDWEVMEDGGYTEWKNKYNLQETPDYNLQRAFELGYNPDETGHLPSVDSQTGEWLKSDKHHTRGMELMQSMLNPEIANNLRLIRNEEGKMQYVPKQKYGGSIPMMPNGGETPKEENGLTFREINDNPLVQTAKMFDPTGFTSWPDAYFAGKDFYEKPSWGGAANVGVNVVGALPMIGKFAMPAKLAMAARRAKSTSTGLSKGINAAVDTLPELLPPVRKLTERTQDFTSKYVTTPIVNKTLTGGKQHQASQVLRANNNVNRVNLANTLADGLSVAESVKKYSSNPKAPLPGQSVQTLPEFSNGGYTWSTNTAQAPTQQVVGSVENVQTSKPSIQPFQKGYVNPNIMTSKTGEEGLGDDLGGMMVTAALAPGSLPFRATTNYGKVALGIGELANPISGFRGLNSMSSSVDNITRNANPERVVYDLDNVGDYQRFLTNNSELPSPPSEIQFMPDGTTRDIYNHQSNSPLSDLNWGRVEGENIYADRSWGNIQNTSIRDLPNEILNSIDLSKYKNLTLEELVIKNPSLADKIKYSLSQKYNLLKNKVVEKDRNIGQFLDKKILNKSQSLDDVLTLANENLKKGMGVAKEKVNINLKAQTDNAIDVFIDGKKTGEIGLPTMTKNRSLSQILLGESNKSMGFENAVFNGRRKTSDFPFSHTTKMAEYEGKGISGEINKSLSEALKSNGERLYSGGTGHSPKGAKRYENLIEKGKVDVIDQNNKIYMYKELGGKIKSSDWEIVG